MDKDMILQEKEAEVIYYQYIKTLFRFFYAFSVLCDAKAKLPDQCNVIFDIRTQMVRNFILNPSVT